jgi:methyltransferase (TIGR00027 family)
MDNISQTAIKAACYRAYHSISDQPKIFDDFLARQLIGEDQYAAFKDQNIGGFKMAAPDFAASFPNDEALLAFMMQAMAAPSLTLSRARYAEDRLEMALKDGVKQYVIVGAGLDTFAWRRPDLVDSLAVFEIDHPKTQSYKLDRLKEFDWKRPENLHFIEADLTSDRLADILADSNYEPAHPTFFSWLGVSYYLPRTAVFDTLKAIADLAVPGSQIVFDFLDSEAFIPEKAAERVKALLTMAQGVGESINMGFDSQSIAHELSFLGLTISEHLWPQEIQQRYFLNRNDNYYACEQAHLIRVVVGKV